MQDAYADVERPQYAHLYLPAALWAEKEGVFTNTERRVNRVGKSPSRPATPSRTCWMFTSLLSASSKGGKMTFPETRVGRVRRDARALQGAPRRTSPA